MNRKVVTKWVINTVFGFTMMVGCLSSTSYAVKQFTLIPDVLKAQRPIGDVDAKSWILVEPNSGWVLASHNDTMRVEPASLTKLMTTYITFKQVQSGELALHDKVLISKKAWKMEGSRMFAEVGDRISVIKMLKGVIVQSGNDASVALAEHIAGSESAFVSLMNETAEALKMKGTHFENATGLPGPKHYSTARDIALLSSALIKEFPDYYAWFSLKKFKHNKIEQPNRNILLNRGIDVDGLKTGHTEAAGYCLAASSQRDELRLIAIVAGATSKQARADYAAMLLEYGHDNYQVDDVSNIAKPIPLRVYEGEKDTVDVNISRQQFVLKPKRQAGEFTYRYNLPVSVQAPLEKGQTLSIAELVFNDQAILDSPMQIAEDVKKGSFYKRGIDKIKRLIEEF